MPAPLLALLGLALALPPQAPELQVEARSGSGAEAPEFAAAVSRALVVTGATVVMGARAGEACARCVHVTVAEERPGLYRIEVREQEHRAQASLQLARDAPVFEKACALAIQARLLITWRAEAEDQQSEAAPEPARTATPAAAAAAPTKETLAKPSPVRVAPADSTPEVPTVAAAPVRENARPSPGPALVEGEPAAAPAATAPKEVPAIATQSAAPEALPPVAVPPPALPARSTEPAPAAAVATAPPAQPTPTALPRSEVTAPAVRPALWPWIPTATGIGAALAAGGCAIASRARFNALSDRSLPLQDAQKARDEGQRLQTTSFVMTGVAAAAVATGVIGFLVGPGQAKVSLGGAPLAGGGALVVSGSLP